MKILAKFILSIEDFFKNPGDWLSKHISFLIAIALIFAAILFLYSKNSPKSTNTATSNQDLVNAISELKKDQKKNHELQLQEMLFLKQDIIQLKHALQIADIDQDDQEEFVPIVEELDTINDSLRQRLQDNSDGSSSDSENFSDTNNQDIDQDIDGAGEKPNPDRIYIKPSSQGTVFYSSPSTSSKEVSGLETGMFYTKLSQQDDWYKIETNKDFDVWINKRHITDLTP